MLDIREYSKSQLVHIMNTHRTFCFGAGKYARSFLKENPKAEIEAVIDNDITKHGQIFSESGYDISIISVEQYSNICRPDDVIIITIIDFYEIIEQLDCIEQLNGVTCVIYYLTKELVEESDEIIFDFPKEEKIPRKIHYCWFGGKDIPYEFLQNIESWKKYCPDYEIIQWNESNYDVSKSLYMKQAYEQKKWAFVADYARIDILNEHGGIYFDTDVEVIRNFDQFLIWDMFCGFEINELINSGLGMGSIRQQKILKKLLNRYDHMEFVDVNGQLNQTPCPAIQSEIMVQSGFQLNGEFQVVDGVAVYPRDYFNPWGYYKGLGNLTKNTHSIHKYSGSWSGKEYHDVRKIWEKRIESVRKRIKV